MAVSNPTQTSSRSVLKVLLIEDNPGDARLITAHLQKTDPRLLGGTIELSTATCLADAADLISTTNFSALLLDLGLPTSQGLDTLHKVLALTSRSPIVILTGLRNEEVAFEAVREGAEDFLHKDDLDKDRLTRSIRYAIERHERKLKTDVIESADLALLLLEVGEQGMTTIFSNQACQDLTGYTLKQWKDIGISALHGDETSQDIPTFLESVRQSGNRTSIETRSYRADGSLFWNKLQAIPLSSDDGTTDHILCSFQDITEQLKWRAQMGDLDRMTTLGTVADGVAHEINNPLSFITANLQFTLRMLEKAAIDEFANLDSGQLLTIVDALRDAIEGSRRVRDVVDDLQQLSGRPDDIVFSTTPLSVVKPVERSLTIARNHITKRARLIRQFEEVPPVLGNESKLGQVFLNILVNAAQAISSGGPKDNEVCISISEVEGEVVVAISDTGTGIEEHHIKRLFEPFFSTKSASQGTGLGLPISKHIVNQLGGRIEVNSTVGEGTTFSVILPTAMSVDTEPEDFLLRPES